MPSAERQNRILVSLRDELGSVTELLSDQAVVEIMLNPDGTLWVERLGSKMEPFGVMDADKARAIISSVAAYENTVVTKDSPILECELPLDKSRFEALIPPAAPAPIFAIRKKSPLIYRFSDYVEQGVMTTAQRGALESAIAREQNILIVGGTGSGKTTLANACVAYMSELCPTERLIIIEDTPEIQSQSQNTVSLRTCAALGMKELLRATLRLRPDRILVGEVRGGEALTLLKSWNVGSSGLATIHANGARAGLLRLEQLVSEASRSPMKAIIGEAVGLVVAIERWGRRPRITEILAVEGFDGEDYLTHSIEEM